jgi:hypothetical protein
LRTDSGFCTLLSAADMPPAIRLADSTFEIFQKLSAVHTPSSVSLENASLSFERNDYNLYYTT